MNANILITSINIPVYIFIEDIQSKTFKDIYTTAGTEGVYNKDWPHRKKEMGHSMRQYWPIRNELAMIDSIAMKDKEK